MEQQHDVGTIPPVTIVAHDIGPVGGMELQLSELIGGLLARGVEVTVVSRTCAIEPHAGLRWVRVPGPGRPFVLAFPLFFLIGSLLVRRHRRGVVHTTGAIVVNRVDVCTVHFCHRAVTGLSRARRRSVLYRLNARLARPLSLVSERFVYRKGRCRTFVAVSGGLATELRNAYPRIAQAVVAIPNGVDHARFHPDAERRDEIRTGLGVADTDFVALFVGSEWPRKGLELALRGIARVEGAHLVVVGQGDVKRYGAIAESLGIEDRVHFVGSVKRPELYHAAADVFVLPTAYETFSLVAHEAAACGVPLLATRVHGIDELIIDGENGWFIERDEAVLAERMAALQSNPARRREFGRSAQARSERYSWQRMTRAYVEAYQGVAA